MIRSRSVRTIIAAVSLLTAPLVAATPAQAKVVKAAATPGEGLLASNQCTSPNADATTAAWDWTKPMLEISSDNGATWVSANTYTNPTPGPEFGRKYAAQVCRNLGGAGSSVSAQSYWFIIQPATGGSDDMGQTVVDLGLQFKVTMPLKTNDVALRMTGYSKVISYQPTTGSVVAIVKASPIAKVNWGNGWDDFKTRHPECAADYTAQTWSQCKISKADRDLVGTVIQHIEFTTTAPTAWQTLGTGVWIGANVNGYQLTMTCASKGGDSGSGSSGGNYSGGSDGGANIPSGSSSSTTPPSLSVSMSGTPHFRSDGATVNKGNMQAFIPETTARTCFGDGTTTIPLATIAQNMSVSRTETSENGGAAQDLPANAYTATAVTGPVAGLLIDVAEMTFSNPTYKVSSKLAQQLLASYSAAAGTTTTTPSSNATTAPTTSAPTSTGTYNTQAGLSTTVTTTVSMSAKVKGAKVTLTVTVGTAQKVKVYKKVGAKLTLVKTLSAKVGANTVSTAHKKGTTYIVKDSKGKTLKSLKP